MRTATYATPTGMWTSSKTASPATTGPELPQTTHDTVTELRRLVRGCIDRHHVASAMFYADKLVTLSPSTPSDVLLFAETCFLHREYHRAIHIVKTAGLLAFETPYTIPPSTLQSYLLVGQSMLAIKHKEECLDLVAKVLPDDEAAIVAFARRSAAQPDETSSINVVSSLALLMGETFEGMGNRDNAMVYYRIALRCDVRCAEAFFHLVEKQMLTTHEQRALLGSLEFSVDETRLLESLYGVHLTKYDAAPSVENRFDVIETKLGLRDNVELSIAKAETYYYYQHDIQKAHEICEWVRESDPFNFKVIPVYVATLVELGKKRELYHYAHQMVDVYPKKAGAWYSVGAYYLLVEKFEAAQRYFHKATTIEPSFAPAWIGFGNAFAAQDESDQAVSSYRTASSLFPGCHLPPLYIGMEHLRTNNLVQAVEFIKQASAICPNDPLIYNELGSVYYKQKNYAMAIDMYMKALELCRHLPERLMEVWEPTLFNLGYAYRKLRRYDDAIRYFRSALRLSPRNASIHAALGFTHHMKGNLEEAIECYHAALAFNPEDSLAGEMITVAFDESLSASRTIQHSLPPPPPPDTAVKRPFSKPGSTSSFGEESVRRNLSLDHSFSSIEHNQQQQSMNCSSLDLSDDSSMNLDE
ncbi:hypothetical protein Poli38472_009043 [Pythium oligandrum]|uniref:Anaphase-promoting complex subunit 6 n=1 Tax=Pythium oligandrum TaxID=41045 RepID=A0A8K1FJF9_PYTOL|nr:hypothetical protein Poli38472_009043 [Pythium oligandrum]|eukprot:TMW64876.1 hypothetical protein Poli38472_009043 [Pythium oligandrum]